MNNRLLMVALYVAAHVLCARSVLAAPTGGAGDQPGSASLDAIVVTAQRRKEKLQDVPVPVTAFSAEQLDQQNSRDMTDLTARAPNLYVTGAADAAAGTAISIRGIGFQDVEKSFDPPIGVILDGVYLGTNTGQLLQSFDFEQVEVLRGPQGTLFGRNTTGGAINVTRSLPQGDEVNGKASVTFGNYGRKDYKGLVNIPLLKDTLWIKFAAFSENDNGFMNNDVNPGNDGAQRYLSGNATIVWKPDEAWDVDLIYDHIRTRSNVTPYVPYNVSTPQPLPIANPRGPAPVQGPDLVCSLYGFCQNAGPAPNQAYTNSYSSQRYDLNAYTANVTWHLPGADLVYTGGYRTSGEDSIVDFDGLPVDIFRVHRPAAYKQTSHEMRIVTTGDSPFQFVGGLYYFTSTYTADQSTFLNFGYFLGLPPSPITGQPATIPDYTANESHQKSDSYATYLHGSYKFTDQLKLTVGARATFDHKSFRLQPETVDQTDAGFNFQGVAASGPLLTGTKSWSNVSPTTTLDYHLTPDVMVYGTYARGYNQGGFNGRGTNANNIGPYNPETVDNFEVGIKSEGLDHRLRVDTTVFHMLYKNKQQAIIIPDAVAGTATIVSNVGQEVINGLEFEMTVIPFVDLTGFSVNVSEGYLDARYTKFSAQIIPGLGVTNNTTLRPVRSPDLTSDIGFAYALGIGPGKSVFNLDYRYVSSWFIDPFNDPRGEVGAASYLDASGSYEFKAAGQTWKVSAFGKNLTNVIRYNQFLDISNVFAFDSQSIGRTFGVELGIKF